MRLQFDIDIKDEAELANIIGCNIHELNEKINKFGKSSILEYLAMIQGVKVFKRGSDILEYRLFLLVDNVFEGKLPDEQVISKLFQTTATESRGYLRSIISKYQYQLKSAIDQTIKAILLNAEAQSAVGPYHITLNSANIIEELNKKLATIDGTLASVTKKRGSVSTYEVTKSSYENLCESLQIQPVLYQEDE
ncbi:hypothetical protein ACEU1J_18235 [Proteus mirabilis]|uniref:hypothetical protein n=1 Tax=Proteus mirabilis TaxID=584 RepID=UPI00162990E7|nr:hypothetical protein [Proteus mirabilis]EKU0928283.1 hypothetical protein [Proteus mirabilis]MBB6686200.1 hypothetical protein [Proteus mirabilis]MBB6688337.1 hypothetical protein [Proteus mirabilis]MDM3803327.1 hypothetical protein [Proteus mirabilis]HBC8823488.1 hypothetical protein [Proteus mirabilis]